LTSVSGRAPFDIISNYFSIKLLDQKKHKQQYFAVFSFKLFSSFSSTVSQEILSNNEESFSITLVWEVTLSIPSQQALFL
jgi:hypothetical protein